MDCTPYQIFKNSFPDVISDLVEIIETAPSDRIDEVILWSYIAGFNDGDGCHRVCVNAETAEVPHLSIAIKGQESFKELVKKNLPPGSVRYDEHRLNIHLNREVLLDTPCILAFSLCLTIKLPQFIITLLMAKSLGLIEKEEKHGPGWYGIFTKIVRRIHGRITSAFNWDHGDSLPVELFRGQFGYYISSRRHRWAVWKRWLCSFRQCSLLPVMQEYVRWTIEGHQRNESWKYGIYRE